MMSQLTRSQKVCDEVFSLESTQTYTWVDSCLSRLMDFVSRLNCREMFVNGRFHGRFLNLFEIKNVRGWKGITAPYFSPLPTPSPWFSPSIMPWFSPLISILTVRVWAFKRATMRAEKRRILWKVFGAVTLLQSLQRVCGLEIGNLYSKALERLGFWVCVSLTIKSRFWVRAWEGFLSVFSSPKGGLRLVECPGAKTRSAAAFLTG